MKIAVSAIKAESSVAPNGAVVTDLKVLELARGHLKLTDWVAFACVVETQKPMNLWKSSSLTR